MSYSGLGAQSVSFSTTSSISGGERVLTSTIQAWLRALGFSVRIDGDWGSQTGSAFAQYAARKGRSAVFTLVDGGRTVVFPQGDLLLKSLRIEGSAAASRTPSQTPAPAPTPAPESPTIEPSPIPSEGSILTRDSIISGVPNWTIFGGVAALAGYFAWKRKG